MSALRQNPKKREEVFLGGDSDLASGSLKSNWELSARQFDGTRGGGFPVSGSLIWSHTIETHSFGRRGLDMARLRMAFLNGTDRNMASNRWNWNLGNSKAPDANNLQSSTV
jgi:hypothetical protein